MAENNDRFEGPDSDFESIDELMKDLESSGAVDLVDFSNLEMMREDETFASMVEEGLSDAEMNELAMAFQTLDEQIAAPDLSDSFAALELDGGEFGNMDEADLDAMLKSLMEESDETESAWVPMENLDTQLEQETEIYEGGKAGEEIDLSVLYADDKTVFSIRNSKKWIAEQYKTASKSTKALIISIASMSGVAVASLVFLLVVVLVGTGNGNGPAFTVTPPSYAFNNASHSLVNLTTTLGDHTVTLNRLLLDEAATVLYFGGMLDPVRYIFTLEDFDGRIYGRHLNLAANPARDYMHNQTVVRFEAIDPLTQGFVISITDLFSGVTSSMELVFDGDTVALGRYLTEAVEVYPGLSDIAINIDHGIFSAASSSINFSIDYNRPDISIVFAQDGLMPPVAMRHMGVLVPLISPMQISRFPEDGLILGGADFNPLRSLTGRADVIFGQMYKQHNLNMTMPTTGMFTAGDERARTIELADHIVTIHGMMRQGPLYVMPLFGAQRPIVDDEAEDEPAEIRVPTTMEVYLAGIAHDGRRVRLAGDVRHDARGTDVIFDTRENETMAQVPLGSLYLEINSISLRLPEIVVPIYLGELGFLPATDIDAAKASIEVAVAQGLPQFAGQFGAVHGIEYAVQTRHVRFEGDSIHARVAERLAFIDEGGLQEVMRHHSVVARGVGGNMEIVRSIIESTERR